MRNGMGRDFLGASAREYGKIYDRVKQIRAASGAALERVGAKVEV